MFVSLGLPVDRRGDPALVGADGVAQVARAAEQAGFGAVFCTDHPAPDATWLRTGGHPTLDPFATLAVAAAATTNLLVHTNLVVLGYRNPLLTAKAVATLDVLSDGRAVVGVGVGYLDAEFVALGVNPRQRGQLADEALAVMVEAWKAEPLDWDGSNFTARNTVVEPAPIQQPHPPLWVGGNSEAAMRRAIHHGAGWAPMPSPAGSEALLGTPAMPDLEALARGVERLGELSAAAGRPAPPDVVAIPPALSGFTGPHWEPQRAIDDISALHGVGARAVVVNLPGTSVAEFVDEVAAFGSGVLDPLAAAGI